MFPQDKTIAVPPGQDGAFVYVPRTLNRQYLTAVMSKAAGRDVSISSIDVANLCADKWGGVSCSGSTVLRLSLTLGDDGRQDIVVKVLAPAELNLFKIDCKFDSRLAEVSWAKWWDSQKVPFVPKVFDARADVTCRELWIIQEHFPQVGWPDVQVAGQKAFVASDDRLAALCGHAAELHAHSSLHRQELAALFGEDGITQGHQCRPDKIVDYLDSLSGDKSFAAMAGLSDDERGKLKSLVEAVRSRPAWVDQWHYVCVTNDLAPDNFAFRAGAKGNELVTFDWGTACLAPMEQDMSILMGRLREIDPARRRKLLQGYLDAFAQMAGVRVDLELFLSRLPWAHLLHHMRLIAEHAESLRWVPHQTRSPKFIRTFITYCQELLAGCDKG